MTIPTEDRAAPSIAGFGDRLTAWLRLFLIEMRRTPAIYAALLIAVTTAWLIWDQLPVGVVRWNEISHSAGSAMIPASAIAAGIAAFVARRDERLRLDDLLAQTAFGQARRDLLSLVSTLVWCLAGYLIPVAGFFTYASANATWAGPIWGYVSITLVTIVLGVAGGWFVGTIFPNRFSVLVAVGAALAVHGVYPLSVRFRTESWIDPDGSVQFVTTEGWYKNLVPYEVLDYNDVTRMLWWGAAWILGISVLLLGAAWWWRHRSFVALIGLSAAALVSGPAAAALVDEEPVMWVQSAYVQPVCEARLDGQIEVCVHPENETLLDDVSAVIEPLLAPIVGIPGVPTRFEEQQPTDYTSDTVWFYLHDEESLDLHVTSSVIRELMRDPNGELLHGAGSAQYVVLAWLLQESGVPSDEASMTTYLPPVSFTRLVDEAIATGITDPNAFAEFMNTGSDKPRDTSFEADVRAAIDRFDALPDDERRAWLEQNWDALRANELTLEDLP